MQTTPRKTIIRFEQAAEQHDGPIKRVIGFVSAKDMIRLLDDATLDANPRSAKVNVVVNDIMASLEGSPEIYQFKTKGVLLGTSSYNQLERQRFELDFEDPAYEGLLDGGHTSLAISMHILSKVIDPKALRKIKLWEDMKLEWKAHRDEIEAIRDHFTFKVPVELLVPANDDGDTVTAFRSALIDICAARNNNAQLTTEAKANQRGFYDEIRKRLPKELADRVEWKTNDWEADSGKPIKVRDLVALAWIPLTRLYETNLLPTKTDKGAPLKFHVIPQNIYRNKGELSVLFDKLMEHPDVSEQKAPPVYELHNEAIASAFEILALLPVLYDKIFCDMGDAYNAAGGRFGKINEVRIPKSGSTPAPFTGAPSKFGVPDGYVIPILYGLKALMVVENGKLRWAVDDPAAFLDQNLQALVGAFKMPMEMAGFDPQKIAKNENSYHFMVGEVEKAFLKLNHFSQIS